MMRAVVLAALLCAGAGSAGAATHTWQVGDASRIRVTGPFDVRVRTGVSAGVRATGPQDAIDRIVVDQRGDTIVIGAKPGSWGNWLNRDRTPLVVDVGVRSLAAASLGGSGGVAIDRVRGDLLDLSLSGSGDLTVGAVDVAQLKLGATGSGDIAVAGRAATATASLAGSGDIHADRLEAGEATITLVGSGDIDLGARRTATVNLAGSGDVRVIGSAQCTVSRRGSGDVTCNGRTVTD